MRFGVCMPIEQAEFIAKLGFDYLEVSAAGLAEMTEAQFADFLQKNEAAPIHAEAANCMFPGSIKLTGDNVDFEAIQTYVHHAIGRLAQAGIKIGVFGSGGSRRVPENFPREKAWVTPVKSTVSPSRWSRCGTKKQIFSQCSRKL